MIYFDQVTKIFPPGCKALDNVSFTISEGEFVSIVGKSGAGKTTILRLIIREEKPTSGHIYFEGMDISKIRKSRLPYYRRKIGIVYQDYKLLPHRTVFENVAFALEILGRPGKEIKELVPKVLALVGMEEKMWNFPHQLSGGEQQRTAIARAIISQPKVLLADEPTGNLDPYNTKEIIDLLLKINQLGTAVILATHNRDVVNLVKKRVIWLEKGKILKDDSTGTFQL